MNGYILQCDLKHYFDSISHQQCLNNMYRYINDKSTYNLTKLFLSSFTNTNKGLGIGSQISQICGIFYCTHLDNYIKIVKRVQILW